MLLSELGVQCICIEAGLVYPGAEYTGSTGVSLVCTEKLGTSLVRGCAPHSLHHSSPSSDHMGTAGGLDKAGAGGALNPHTRTGGAHRGPPLTAPQCSDYRQVAPRSKRSSDLFESSNKSRVVGLVCLKMLDLAVHLYTVAVSSFSLHLAVANLHQV